MLLADQQEPHFPNYSIVYSKVLQAVLKKLDTYYKSFFRLWKNGIKDARPPKFKSKKYFFTLPYNQSGFKINNGIINFSHKYNDVKLSFVIQDELKDMKIKNIEIYNTVPYHKMPIGQAIRNFSIIYKQGYNL